MALSFTAQAQDVAALISAGTDLAQAAQYADAEGDFHKALDLCARTCPQRASILSNLGFVERHQDRLDAAADFYQQAFELLRGHLSDPDLGAVLNNLAAVRAAQGRVKDAGRLFHEAIAAWERIYGPEHPFIAAALNGLAVLEQSRGHFSEAERLLARAMRIDEQNFPLEHARIAIDLNNQAALAAGRKRYHDAEDLLTRSLAILQAALPPDHPEIGKVWANLGFAFASQKQMSQSADAYRRALQILSRTWGPEDRRLLRWIEQYATVLRTQENFAEAAKQDLHATRIRVVHTLR